MSRSSSSSDDSSARGSGSSESDANDAPNGGTTSTRRRYLAFAGGYGGLSATTSGFASPGTGSDGSTAASDDGGPDDVDDLPLFDAHTHITPAGARGREPLSAAQLVDWMDAVGVDRAVVLPFDSPESFPVQVPTPWVLEEVEAYPDRLVPFCSIDPWDVDDWETATELLERYIERGARGFGELKVEMDIDDDRLEPLYERCGDYGLPIIFHTDQHTMTDDVGLPRLEDVLASYPDVDFVAHAHGWWAHIDGDVEPADLGDIPEGEITSRGRIWDLLTEYDNVYGDISTLAGWNALTRDREAGQAFLEAHHDQIVFGSDYLFPDQAIPHLDLFDEFDLELEAWADIRYRNIEGLLR